MESCLRKGKGDQDIWNLSSHCNSQFSFLMAIPLKWESPPKCCFIVSFLNKNCEGCIIRFLHCNPPKCGLEVKVWSNLTLLRLNRKKMDKKDLMETDKSLWRCYIFKWCKQCTPYYIGSLVLTDPDLAVMKSTQVIQSFESGAAQLSNSSETGATILMYYKLCYCYCLRCYKEKICFSSDTFRTDTAHCAIANGNSIVYRNHKVCDG